MTPLRVALVAGETSGDMLAAHLLRAMKQRWPELQAFGIGGPRMAEQGFQAWWPHEKLAVRGYVEVLRHYREIVGIRRELCAKLIADPPDVFIGVDAPDFNLELERQLKAAGVKTVHFISPSIWAWRGERIDLIRAACDRVLCIFPFEPAIYDRAGIAASYVGHPLAAVIPEKPDSQAARARLGLQPDAKVLAVLPGSRASEIQYIAQTFFDAIGGIQAHDDAIETVVPVVSSQRAAVEVALAKSSLKRSPKLHLLDGRSHDALEACDVAMVASGTATLETAMYQRPMVIGYRMHWLSWQLTKRKKYQPWVGLPNIMAERFVVPELIQEACTPQALREAVLDWWRDPNRAQAVREEFAQQARQLRRDTATLATDAIAEVLAQKSRS
jgi:lipid-A-disaccharide synthase